MSIQKMPPIQISSSDPLILGSKRPTLTPSYEVIGHKDVHMPSVQYIPVAPTATPEIPIEFPISEDGIIQGAADPYGNLKYVMDITEQSRLEKMGSQTSIEVDSNDFNSDSECEEESIKEIDDKRQLRRVGTCFAVIRKVSSRHEIGGRRTSIPGEVECDDLMDAVPGCANTNHSNAIENNTFSNLWSFKLLHSCTGRSERFLEHCQNISMQMRKFISKLRNALSHEHEYIAHLDSVMDQYLGQSVLNNTYGLNHLETDYENEVLRNISPPKLGKVHIELQVHFKAWDDIMKKWQSLRQGDSVYMVKQLLVLQKRVKTYQTEMLELTQKLIEQRLRSLTSCAVVRGKKDEAEAEWSHVLGAGSLKRFCKLIEAYNNILRRNSNEKKRPSEDVRSSSPFYIESLPTSLYSDDKHFTFSDCQPCVSVPFSVSRLLSILCQPAKEELATSMMKIISLLQSSRSNSEEEEDFLSELNTNIEWGNAKDVQKDEDDITTHVSGVPLPSVPNDAASSETFLSVRQLIYSQGSFVISFMKCLAGNTSLLRGRKKTKSPRSTSFSQLFPEDLASNMSSDDEVSSVASSSFFSQMSGTPTSSRIKKTVLWRDSWDQDAVRSFSKLYISSIVSKGPGSSMQLQVATSDSSKSATVHKWMREDIQSQRFRTGMQTLHLESLLSNLSILDLMNEDVIESSQLSIHTFIIEKALGDWDSYTCQALAIGEMDKCGSLPVEGTQQALTKTGWTYVKTIHPLMYIMDRFRDNEVVAQNALPRLESTLDALHRWCYMKIQHYLASWSLRPLMQVSLGDLSQLTVVALHCLPLVEKCHNFVESRRMENPATLHLATKHLKNIDDIITNMQTLSGDCMRAYLKKSAHLAESIVEKVFPSNKVWRQKNLTDHCSASTYMEHCVKSLVVPVCTAVSVLDPRSQLASVPPMVSALVDSILKHIFNKKIIFSVEGALQLRRDFEHILDVACSDTSNLCQEVRRSLPFCKAMKRGIRVCKLLQRTDVVQETKLGAKGYQINQCQNNGQSHVSDVGAEYEKDEISWMPKEKEILALRLISKNRKKKWFSLPCSDNAME
nr:uncharacterized protein LOC100185144 isoform X1 [Ciona intestinalis]|eukprot:XP_002123234.1 uncharacterized protein LOC100185144 isoform X1 [Ciona intestinalis]